MDAGFIAYVEMTLLWNTFMSMEKDKFARAMQEIEVKGLIAQVKKRNSPPRFSPTRDQFDWMSSEMLAGRIDIK